MLKILRLIVSIWKKNIGSNIIVMIMICMSCYIGSLAFKEIHAVYSEYLFVKNSRISRSLIYMGREVKKINTGDPQRPMYMGVDTELMKNMVKYAEDSGIVDGASQFLSFYIKPSGKETSHAIVYDEITASYIKNTAKIKGSWLFEKEASQKDCYPAVVYNSNYNIGDIIEADLIMGAQTGPIKGGPIPNKTVHIKVEVVGKVTAFDPFIPYFGVTKGSNPSNEDALGLLGSNGYDSCTDVFFFPYIEEYGDYAYSNDTAFFYFNDDATDEEINAFYENAKEFGYCGLGSDFEEHNKRTADLIFRNDFFLYLSIAGLMLTSIVCISFLNLKKLKKDFSIYYLNGCSFFKSSIIYFIYFILMYGISLIASLTITQIKILIDLIDGHGFNSEYLYADPDAISLICVIGLLISVISAAIPFIIIKRKTPIQNIKES